MNKRLLIFIGALVVLAAGGGLTSFIAAEGAGSLIPGVLTVTRHPEASVTAFGGNQGARFFLLILFIVFNLVGASLTGALIFWFLNREVERAKVEEAPQHEDWVEGVPGLRRLRQPQEDEARQLPAEAETSS